MFIMFTGFFFILTAATAMAMAIVAPMRMASIIGGIRVGMVGAMSRPMVGSCSSV